MKNPATSIKETQVKKNRENKISIIVGSSFVIAAISAVILGIIFPVTIPYSLEIFRWSALFLLAAIAWQDVFHAEESKQHQRSL